MVFEQPSCVGKNINLRIPPKNCDGCLKKSFLPKKNTDSYLMNANDTYIFFRNKIQTILTKSHANHAPISSFHIETISTL